MFNSDCCSVISNRRASCQTLIHSRLVRHPIRGLPICEPASRSYPHQHQSPELPAASFFDRTSRTTLTDRAVSQRFRSPQVVRKSKIFVITRDFVSRMTLIWNVPSLSELDSAWYLTARVMRLSARHADHHNYYLPTNRAKYYESLRGVGFTSRQSP